MSAARHTIRDGLVVGLIGYAAVALFYSGFDLLASRGPLHTVNLLGQAVFRGLRDASVLQFPLALDPGAAFAYNALHLVVALAIGLIVSMLVTLGERHPERRAVVRMVIVAGFVVTVVVVGLLTVPLRALVPWWSIVLANALAAFFAGAWLLTSRPGLWQRLALGQAQMATPVSASGSR
ncbi:MAG TPA: hypothetical protein VFO55_01330 [Gemmatimonadaceae bacterium]|nr:hypothetical protein [Gemmatimonadaceae bacterium]